VCIVQRYLLGNDEGNNMKTLIKVVLGSIGLLAAGAIAVAGYLIYPGTPSRSSSLIFQGYPLYPSIDRGLGQTRNLARYGGR